MHFGIFHEMNLNLLKYLESQKTLLTMISLNKINISTKCASKLTSSPFNKFVLSSCFKKYLHEAHVLYMLCRRFDCTDVFFDFVSTILLYKCFIKPTCKCYFITNVANT